MVQPDIGGLDFGNLLSSMGIDDIDTFIDGKKQASDKEEEKQIDTGKKPQKNNEEFKS